MSAHSPDPPYPQTADENTDDAPARMLADDGYLSEGSLEELRRLRRRRLVATGREGK